MAKMSGFKNGIIITLIYSIVPLLLAATNGPDKITSETGDLLLVGFFPVHEAIGTSGCGKIKEEGFRQLETFLYKVKSINNDSSILPNVTLGMIVLDTCDSPDGALETALRHLQLNLQCKVSNATFKTITAVIGGRSSGETIKLAQLFRIFKIPQVSYKASAPSLSNKKMYEYFFRTVPPINHQAEALIEIIKYHEWTFISVVYSHSEDGNSAFESLHKLAASDHICIASEQRVNLVTFNDTDYDDVIQELRSVKARVVVLLGEKLMAQKIMAATNRTGLRNRFVWLGNEDWCYKDDVVKNYEEYAEGAICITYGSVTPKEMIEHFRNLTEDNSTKPWLREFLATKSQCRLPTSPGEQYNNNCLIESDSMINYTDKMPTVKLVWDAVNSIAKALHDIHNDLCEGEPGMCDAMRNINGEMIREYLMRVTINQTYDKGTSEDLKFDEEGDILRKYTIVNYRIWYGAYKWKKVGTYEMFKNSRGVFTPFKGQIKFKSNESFPESVCSTPCLPRQGKKVLDSMKCCWTCFNCSESQYVNEDGWCKTCDKGYVLSENKTVCEKVSVFMDFGHRYAIACITLAVLGILVTAAVSVVFWRYWETPIIKASARELSALLLLGIFLSFLLTFPIIKKPTEATCICVRFFLGFNYTLCYAAIVVKARRIACIFENVRKLNPKKTRPKSQLLMAALLVSIEVVIIISWFIYDFPTTEYLTRSEGGTVLICSGSNSPSYLLGLLYPFLLMILCTGYAYKTRKCPDGFNEARYITFTNYATCVIWTIFLPMFSMLKSTFVRTVMLSLLLSLSGAVYLACLFFPKAYIAILKPQNNTKDVVMGHTSATPSTTTSN